MDVQALISEAEEQLDVGDYEGAIRTGKRLLKLRHSFGFEAMARGYWGLGKKKKAFRALEDGLAKVPAAWGMWELLGNYSSDEEDYVRAHECYERALQCPGVDPSGIHLNVAIALDREERLDEALRRLELVTNDEMRLAAAAVRARALNAMELHDDAIATAEAALALDDEDEHGDRARLHYAIAHALWRKGEHDRALQKCWDVIAVQPWHEGAMWLIRELEARRSASARGLRVIVHGKWPEPVADRESSGFYIGYDVVAADEDEALELIRRFEPEKVRASLSLAKVKRLRGKFDDQPKGVYWRNGGYTFYQEA